MFRHLERYLCTDIFLCIDIYKILLLCIDILKNNFSYVSCICLDVGKKTLKNHWYRGNKTTIVNAIGMFTLEIFFEQF